MDFKPIVVIDPNKFTNMCSPAARPAARYGASVHAVSRQVGVRTVGGTQL